MLNKDERYLDLLQKNEQEERKKLQIISRELTQNITCSFRKLMKWVRRIKHNTQHIPLETKDEKNHSIKMKGLSMCMTSPQFLYLLSVQTSL